MSRLARARFDWRGWRADVVERLEWRWIGAACGWVAIATALNLAGQYGVSVVASYTIFKLCAVLTILVILAVAMVAIARGVSAWLAYPAAVVVAFAIGSLLGVVIDPWHWLAATPPPPLHTVVRAHVYFLSILIPPAVLYVYASNAAHNAKALRAVEAERAGEAERLAQQRLQTELATVDHDLVLEAMRLALNAPLHQATQAQSLLEAVTAYLRVAQQRGSSEPGRIAAALAELRQLSANRGGQRDQPVIA